MEQINSVTKSDVAEYILNKDYIQVENAGRFFKCRVGERSHMDGFFTSRMKAEQALNIYIGEVIERSRKQIAKREANKNAKKNES